jgi:hypothetical protein
MNARVGSIATSFGVEGALNGDDLKCVKAPVLGSMAKA